ncbi:MAG: nucleotide exchange factor GrpE [Patescibacteria group bacterium]
METSDEEFVSEEETEEGPALIKRLRERLKKAVEEKQEYLEGWQRARADFANFKREEAGIHQDKEARLRADFAEALLPALDAFEMAFKTKWYESASLEWKGGVMSIYRELVRSLDRFGVKLFTPLGEPFDPARHEAVREVPVEDKKQDHTVVSVERSGYSVGDTIIRPAQVTVGNHHQ